MPVYSKVRPGCSCVGSFCCNVLVGMSSKPYLGGKLFLSAPSACSREVSDSPVTLALFDKMISSYLPGTGVNHDHEGDSPRVRLFHCTEEELTSTITPNVGNSSASFLLVGDCVRAIPCYSLSPWRNGGNEDYEMHQSFVVTLGMGCRMDSHGMAWYECLISLVCI